MIRQILVFFVCVVSLIHGQKKLHEQMTKEEIEAVFNRKHNEIHDIKYELVPVYHKTDEESTKEIHLKAFKKNYTLYLEQNNNVLLGSHTPVFIADEDFGGRQLQSIGKKSESKIIYTSIQYPLPDNFDLYHDLKNRAAVTVQKDSNDNVNIDGVIGDKIIIRPIPTRVHRKILEEFGNFDRSPFVKKLLDRSDPFSQDPYSYDPFLNDFNQTSHHIVVIPDNVDDDESIETIEHTGSDLHKNQSINTNDTDTVYPKIMIAIDYETYRVHGSNIQSVAKYMAGFWNAVDLRFREMTDPSVRLNIAGLIVPREPSAVPYFVQNDDGDVNLVHKSLVDLGEYFAYQKKFPHDSYDVVMGIINKKLRYIYNGTVHDDTTGLANVNTTCLTDTNAASVIIRDKGGYNGITTAAHELAHVFGVPHDGDDSKDIPGGPCNWHDGYLMSYERRTSNGVHWSNCSITAMRMTFKSEQSECLKKKPVIGKPYPKLLPGRLLSRDEQCQRTMNLLADKSQESDCAILYCGNNETQFRPPAEGSTCGKEKICLNAVCFKVPENFHY